MIKVVYSTQHWIVPIIVLVVLAVLLVAIVMTEGLAHKKKSGSFFKKPERFFIENYDKMKFWGTIVLFVAYIFLLNIFGFTITSIIFMFLFNSLYAGLSKKAIIPSIIISIVAPLIVSILFGVVFNITLPSGIFTMTFANFGFTIY